MVLADFTIRVKYDQPRDVRVIVYDSIKGFRIAATRYDNTSKSKTRKGRGMNSNTLAICHRFELLDDGKSLPLCSIVRLAEPNLGVGIVSHELAHAALWVYELSEDKPLVCDNDERFAWVLGELVRQTVTQLYERGVYDPAERGK
jgi:hypothetical protein